MQPLEQQLSCAMDASMAGKNCKDNSFLHDDEFCIGARLYFWLKSGRLLTTFQRIGVIVFASCLGISLIMYLQ
jgi:hypothetical protein